MRGLRDKVILVTGGAQGIGKATALRLAEENAVLVVGDRNGRGAEAVADDIRANGGKARSVELDVSSRQSWQDAAVRINDDLGGLDGLVNNAGVTRDKSLLKMAEEDWDLVINVNLKGAWLGCQAIVPLMIGRNGGSIVNLSSESRWGAFGQSNYSSAKAGLVGLTRTVALEQARNGIRVNAIAPGTTMTPMVEAVAEEIRKGWLDSIPLKREAQPSEIAAAIAFLLSEDASYITGQILGVNGGSAL